MSDIRWNSIRAIGGSQWDGFEELCAQLARRESPADSDFIRTGSQDAGVECFCVLSNGHEWGWQSKFFTVALRETQWSQLDKSVVKALESHPNLKRYFVCVPRDRSDGRRPGITTELDRWNDRVRQWRRWAADRDMDVEFVWWGSSELTERLTDTEHAGRVEFWFGDMTRFSEGWFQSRIDEAVESAGPRYTPEVNIDLSVAERLRLFGREAEALNFIKTDTKEIRDAFRLLRPRKDRDAVFAEQIGFDKLAEADVAIRAALQRLAAPPHTNLEIGQLIEEIDVALEQVDGSLSLLSSWESGSVPEPGTVPSGREGRKDRNNDTRSLLYNLSRALSGARAHLQRADALVNGNLLILTGEAGIGKTHLLCDVARQRVGSGMPTVLLTGQRFLTKEAPWIQALQQLDLTNLRGEDFLGALEAAAQMANSRALLMIDAINEGEGPDIWPAHLGSFVQQVNRSPWIACVISVRSPYRDIVIPEQVRAKAVTITHAGFADRPYEAAKAYFEHYGLNLPSTPLLQPEFENPLFLKLLCQGLRGRGFRALPRDQYGVSEVFDGLLEDVNARLAKRLDYNPDDRAVHSALSALAAIFAEQKVRWMPQREAVKVANVLDSSGGFSTSLYRALVSEGLLLENPDFSDPKRKGKIVSIAYERFADHLIAQHLIESHVDKGDPAEAFQPDGRLAFLADSDNFVWRGVLEALCIQVPQKLDLELPEIMPTLFESQWACSAFLSSLTWRSSQGHTDGEERQFIEMLRRDSGVNRGDVFDTLLKVATFPDHPLNADYLHKFLQRWSMPDRDARWSVYLHESYGLGEGGPVDRLLDWTAALSVEARDSLESDVVELAATTLAWMLSTSNRFVRDRATKGLAWLLTGRLEETARLVERFHEIDDPYVVERVYAVAYGVASRCHERAEIEVLATVVYESVFADGEAPPHILLRDYARGVVERALHLGADIGVEKALVCPPYQSTWPEIPSENELARLTPRWQDETLTRWDPEQSRNRVRRSVMDDDFAFYVIGTNHRQSDWLALPRTTERFQSPEQRMAALEVSLAESTKGTLEELARAETAVRLVEFSGPPVRWGLDDENFEEDEEEVRAWEAERDQANKKAELLLAEALALLKEDEMKEFLSIREASLAGKPMFDLNIIQRYVLGRVFDLGWTVELFGRFDRSVGEFRGRNADKPERIGKKYQWIAYHEILAYISDHFQYHERFGDRLSDSNYQGPWQISVRDIDPTVSLASQASGREVMGERTPWWRREAYSAWTELPDKERWLERMSDIPSLESLVRVREHPNGASWINVRLTPTWRQPIPPGFESHEVAHREVWLHATGYFIPTQGADDFLDWAQRADFWNHWMPEPYSEYQLFIGEHGWGPAFQDIHGSAIEGSTPTSPSGRVSPTAVRIAAFEYNTRCDEYDCSTEERSTLHVPHPDFIEKLNLRWSGGRAEFLDQGGKVAAFDPMSTRGESGSLLFREDLLGEYLDGENLALIWTVIGEKRALKPDPSLPWDGSSRFSGAYRYTSGGLEGAVEIKTDPPSSGT